MISNFTRRKQESDQDSVFFPPQTPYRHFDFLLREWLANLRQFFYPTPQPILAVQEAAKPSLNGLRIEDFLEMLLKGPFRFFILYNFSLEFQSKERVISFSHVSSFVEESSIKTPPA